MKKVTIVTNSVGGGGAERAMNLLSNELTDRRYSTTLVPINNGVEDSVSIKCQVSYVGRNPTAGLFSTWKSLTKFVKLVSSNNPDFILLNCDLPELFGLFIKSGPNLFIIEHSNPAWTTRPIIGRLVRNIHKLKGTKFLAVSSHLTIWPNGEKPWRIVNNIIDIPRLGEPRDFSHSRILRLVFIGRMAKIQKRPSWLITMARELSLPVVFIGQGLEEQNLQNEAKSKLVDASFIGHQIDPWSFILPGDLLVVPSFFEGDGLVVVEAIAQKVPLILSDIRDFRRFNLPDHFYAHNISNFINLIELNRSDISKFIVPDTLSQELLQIRKSSNVGDTWERVLNHGGQNL